MGEHRRLLDSLLEVSELVERFQGPHGCSETNKFIFHFFLEVLHIVRSRRGRRLAPLVLRILEYGKE